MPIQLALSIVKARIFRDNTGAFTELPVLLTEQGPIDSLLRYQLLYWSRSRSWHMNLLRSVRLLIEYAVANAGAFKNVKDLFQAFSVRLYSGTVGLDGLDPSGLYWKPLSRAYARITVNVLTEFSNWHAREYKGDPINPIRDATKYEEILQWVGWSHRNGQSFLGHNESEARAQEATKLSPWVRPLAPPKVYDEEGKAFPEDKFADLILNGFATRASAVHPLARVNLRDVLITLMQHGAGVRTSECFHLWMHDVMPHPLDPTVALVRIHHPSEGYIEWTDKLGKTVKDNRAAYLAAHGVTPRHLLSSKSRAGWKNPACDAKWYMELKWFPKEYGRIFLSLWEIYLRQVQPLPRNHPYAWVTFEGPNPGGVFALPHYIRAHERAVERLGLVSAKHKGTTPHGHRHAYGHRLRLAGIQPEIRQRCMHHGSLFSQVVYTEAQTSEVNTALSTAVEKLDAGMCVGVQDLISKMGTLNNAFDTTLYKRLYQ